MFLKVSYAELNNKASQFFVVSRIYSPTAIVDEQSHMTSLGIKTVFGKYNFFCLATNSRCAKPKMFSVWQRDVAFCLNRSPIRRENERVRAGFNGGEFETALWEQEPTETGR